MGKNTKRRKNRNHNRQHPSIEPTAPKGLKQKSASSSTEVCSYCGSNLSSDRQLPSLGYCPHCSLFFWEPKSNVRQNSLASVFAAIRRISDSDILFSERIPGIVCAIFPDMDEGLLEILRRLHSPENRSFVEAIRQDEELNEIEISLFVNRAGLDYGKVVSVCDALRKALDKSVIATAYSSSGSKNEYILDLSSSSTEALPGEKIQIRWMAVEGPKLTYILTSDNGSKKVKPNGSLWIDPVKDLEVTLKVLYRNSQIDSKSLLIKIAPPPVIHHLACNLPSPVMESDILRISWHTENADRVTLIHHYNDYERLTIDVSDCGGAFSFTALRTEQLEIIAERKSLKATKTIMIDVVPLPKFKVSEIPRKVSNNFPVSEKSVKAVILQISISGKIVS